MSSTALRHYPPANGVEIGAERARDYIRRNLTEAIRLSTPCRYACTEARTLEYGFLDVVGLSPMQYVRTTASGADTVPAGPT